MGNGYDRIQYRTTSRQPEAQNDVLNLHYLLQATECNVTPDNMENLFRISDVYTDNSQLSEDSRGQVYPTGLAYTHFSDEFFVPFHVPLASYAFSAAANIVSKH
jgi:hypothetical protein